MLAAQLWQLGAEGGPLHQWSAGAGLHPSAKAGLCPSAVAGLCPSAEAGLHPRAEANLRAVADLPLAEAGLPQQWTWCNKDYIWEGAATVVVTTTRLKT